MKDIIEELNKLKINSQFRKIPNIENKFNRMIIVDGVKYINFASNDYLGISTKENLRKEFLAQNNSLMSSASARLLTGSSAEYNSLELTIAELFNKDACLIFNTGYQANLGVLSSIIKKGDVVFSDKLNHASIIDGMKLSDGDFYRFKHCDYESLENLLQTKRQKYKRAIIVSESIFSMDGDIADIDKLIELKNNYNCMLMIDEAHAFCTYGKHLSGMTFGKDVDIITATFGKAVGSFGAFCVADRNIIDYLINKARSFIFSTSIPPINIAWSNWLLTKKKDYLESKKIELEKITEEAHSLIQEYELKTSSSTHIIPIITGSNENTINISEKLRSLGYYIPAIRPPTVSIGNSRIRISLTADTNIKDFENIILNLK